MARLSKAEREFIAEYPHANVRPVHVPIMKYAVYAGDYLCAAGRTRAEAFKVALRFVRLGYITPDPSEKVGDFPDAR